MGPTPRVIVQSAIGAPLAAIALGTVLLHAGQDLVLGEPARLGVPAWLFAAAFLGHAALTALAILLQPWSMLARGALVVLAGAVPLGIAWFHRDELRAGGAYGGVLVAMLVAGLAVTLLVAGMALAQAVHRRRIARALA